MANFGKWNVKVAFNYPQKVASALVTLQETKLGVEYDPIAYIGSQDLQANGVNHAVLAEQTVLSGKDTKNAVVLIFNEKPNDMNATLVNIERVVESGGEMGGIQVNCTAEIPADAIQSFNKVMEGFVGSQITLFAYLGSQVVKGTNHLFAATLTPITQNPTDRAVLAIANDLTGDLSFTDLLGTKHDSLQLGYVFAWLKRANTSLNAPLGEWP